LGLQEINKTFFCCLHHQIFHLKKIDVQREKREGGGGIKRQKGIRKNNKPNKKWGTRKKITKPKDKGVLEKNNKPKRQWGIRKK